MIDLPTRIRFSSLASLYLADSGKPTRRHACWQSPFALGTAADRADRERRIKLAGELWLRNFDLRFSGQLWIFDDEAGTSWAFRRCRRPGGRHLKVGPMPEVMHMGGRPLFGYRLRYRECDDADLDKLLLSLVEPKAA